MLKCLSTVELRSFLDFSKKGWYSFFTCVIIFIDSRYNDNKTAQLYTVFHKNNQVLNCP